MQFGHGKMSRGAEKRGEVFGAGKRKR